MIHRCLVAAWVTGATLLSSAAYADCPDGWFCDDARDAGPGAPPASEAPGDRADDRRVPPPPSPDDREYDEDAEPRIDVSPPPEPPRKKRRRKEYGLNLHGDLALFGAEDSADSSGMAGVGAAFRFRPHPMFGVDLGLDFLGGHDWNGNRRD